MRRRTPLAKASAVLALAGATLFAASVITACGNDYPRSEASYCASVHSHLTRLQGAEVLTNSDISSMLDAWRSVAATAPLQVQPEWATVVKALEAAVKVDLRSPDAVQTMAATVRASTPAANRVIAYTYKKCAELIGKVKPVATTIPPQVFPPTTT